MLNAVAAAPPKRFAGGGAWEAMHGDMTGWFDEQRLVVPLCLVVREAKSVETVPGDGTTGCSAGDYAAVRALGLEYRRRNPRSLC